MPYNTRAYDYRVVAIYTRIYVTRVGRCDGKWVPRKRGIRETSGLITNPALVPSARRVIKRNYGRLRSNTRRVPARNIAGGRTIRTDRRS